MSEATIMASLGAIRALAIVLTGDPEARTKDMGLLSKKAMGGRHLERCQVGLWLQAGDSQRGGQPCSQRCQAAQRALGLGADACALLLAELADLPGAPEQLSWLEAV